MSGVAPYRRIAAEIRGRIDRGELGPGDRVPSTREITKEWGVAMATATKVIAALRDDGVVDTRPGMGTVVRVTEIGAPRTTGPRAAHRAPELSKERVVRAAMAVADTDGLGMLSMRRVANDLGVATMSLYRHVPGKDELTLLMVDAAFTEEPFPDQLPAGWRARLEIAARLMWTVFRRHPWAAELMSMTRPQALPSLLAYAEWCMSALHEAGFGVDDIMHCYISLFGHVRAVGQGLQSEVEEQQDTGMTNEEWVDTQESNWRALIASGRYPTFERMTKVSYDYDVDTLFDAGLQLLLDGIEVKVRRLHR